MKKNILQILLLMLAFFSSQVFSSEKNAETTKNIKTEEDFFHENPIIDGVIGLVLVESLFGLNSWMASENPHVFGGFAALLFPMGVGGDGTISDTGVWINLVGAESIALYNLSVDTNKVSKNEIFENNFIAWHVFTGVIVATKYLFPKLEKNKALNFQPVENGGIRLSYNIDF